MTPMSDKPTVLITRRIPASLVERIAADCSVRYWDSNDTLGRAELLAQGCGVDGIYCLIPDRIDAEVLGADGPSLRRQHHVGGRRSHRRGCLQDAKIAVGHARRADRG